MPGPKDPPIQVVIKPSVAKLKAEHKKRLERLKSAKPAFTKVSIFLDQWVQRNFRTEGGNVGKWEPFVYGGRLTTKTGKRSGKPNLKPNFVLINPRRYVNTQAKLLQDTGRLKSSYMPFASRMNAGIGTNLPYAKGHEEGLGNLPMRRTLPERREVIDDAKRILETHVKKAIKK